MSLIGQFVSDVAQNSKTGGGAVIVSTNLGILAILEQGLGLVVIILSGVLTIVLIRTHRLKMTILQNEVDEIKRNKNHGKRVK